MATLRRFRGKTGAQLEIAAVEERTGIAFQKNLGRAEDMSRRQQPQAGVGEAGRAILHPGEMERLAKREDVLPAFLPPPGEAFRHKP